MAKGLVGGSLIDLIDGNKQNVDEWQNIEWIHDMTVKPALTHTSPPNHWEVDKFSHLFRVLVEDNFTVNCRRTSPDLSAAFRFFDFRIICQCIWQNGFVYIIILIIPLYLYIFIQEIWIKIAETDWIWVFSWLKTLWSRVFVVFFRCFIIHRCFTYWVFSHLGPRVSSWPAHPIKPWLTG